MSFHWCIHCLCVYFICPTNSYLCTCKTAAVLLPSPTNLRRIWYFPKALDSPVLWDAQLLLMASQCHSRNCRASSFKTYQKCSPTMWPHVHSAKKNVLGLKVTTQLYRPWHCASCREDRRQRSMAVGRRCSRNRSRGRAQNTRIRIRRWEGIWSATGCCLHLPEKDTLESFENWKGCQHTTAKKKQFASPLSFHLLPKRRNSRCISSFNLQKTVVWTTIRCKKHLGPASSLQRSSAPAPVMGVLAGVRPDNVLSSRRNPWRNPWLGWRLAAPCLVHVMVS